MSHCRSQASFNIDVIVFRVTHAMPVPFIHLCGSIIRRFDRSGLPRAGRCIRTVHGSQLLARSGLCRYWQFTAIVITVTEAVFLVASSRGIFLRSGLCRCCRYWQFTAIVITVTEAVFLIASSCGIFLRSGLSRQCKCWRLIVFTVTEAVFLVTSSYRSRGFESLLCRCSWFPDCGAATFSGSELRYVN